MKSKKRQKWSKKILVWVFPNERAIDRLTFGYRTEYDVCGRATCWPYRIKGKFLLRNHNLKQKQTYIITTTTTKEKHKKNYKKFNY